MKKKTGLITLMMLMATIMFAQHHKGGHGRHHFGKHEDQSETMKTVLSLDDNQYASIKTIQAKYADKQRSVYKDSLMAADQKKASSKALRKERKKEIDAVLTPDQKTKWDTYKKEQVVKRREEHKQNIERRHAEMKTSLGLSDDQFSKMKAADEAFRKKMHAAKKKYKGEKGKTEFKSVYVEHETAVKSILTEEQFKKWTSLSEERRVQYRHHKGRKRG